MAVLLCRVFESVSQVRRPVRHIDFGNFSRFTPGDTIWPNTWTSSLRVFLFPGEHVIRVGALRLSQTFHKPVTLGVLG